MLAVLVTGGREFGAPPDDPAERVRVGNRDYSRSAIRLVASVFHASKRAPDLVIHGAARGADSVVDYVCGRYDIRCSRHPVTNQDWETKGKAAGMMRNAAMLAELRQLQEDDWVIETWAFSIDMKSRGTWGMSRLSVLADVPTFWFAPTKVRNGIIVDQDFVVRKLDRRFFDLPN